MTRRALWKTRVSCNPRLASTANQGKAGPGVYGRHPARSSSAVKVLANPPAIGAFGSVIQIAANARGDRLPVSTAHERELRRVAYRFEHPVSPPAGSHSVRTDRSRSWRHIRGCRYCPSWICVVPWFGNAKKGTVRVPDEHRQVIQDLLGIDVRESHGLADGTASELRMRAACARREPSMTRGIRPGIMLCCSLIAMPTPQAQSAACLPARAPPTRTQRHGRSDLLSPQTFSNQHGEVYSQYRQHRRARPTFSDRYRSREGQDPHCNAGSTEPSSPTSQAGRAVLASHLTERIG